MTLDLKILFTLFSNRRSFLSYICWKCTQCDSDSAAFFLFSWLTSIEKCQHNISFYRNNCGCEWFSKNFPISCGTMRTEKYILFYEHNIYHSNEKLLQNKLQSKINCKINLHWISLNVLVNAKWILRLYEFWSKNT